MNRTRYWHRSSNFFPLVHASSGPHATCRRCKLLASHSIYGHYWSISWRYSYVKALVRLRVRTVSWSTWPDRDDTVLCLSQLRFFPWNHDHGHTAVRTDHARRRSYRHRPESVERDEWASILNAFHSHAALLFPGQYLSAKRRRRLASASAKSSRSARKTSLLASAIAKRMAPSTKRMTSVSRHCAAIRAGITTVLTCQYQQRRGCCPL